MIALNDTFHIKINGEVFTIKLVEESHSPMHINVKNSVDIYSSEDSSKDGRFWGCNNSNELLELSENGSETLRTKRQRGSNIEEG